MRTRLHGKRRSRKIIYNKKHNKNRRFAAFLFVMVTGITLGCLAFYLLDITLLSNQAKQALSPLVQNPSDKSILNGLSTYGVENSVPTPINDESKVVFHGSRTKKQIALTFDADMTPGMLELLQSGRVNSYYDKKLVDVLTVTNTKATIFVTGLWIEAYPVITKQLAANTLFELANHSYSHPSFYGYCYGLPQLSGSQDAEEIQKTQALLKKATGVTNTLFRFPGGCYSPEKSKLVEQAGLTVIQWDVAGQDGFNDNRSIIETNILTNVTNGSIIVLHFNGYPNEPVTADVLPDIIHKLKEQGYEFVTVSELLAPPSRTSFRFKQYLPHLYAFL